MVQPNAAYLITNILADDNARVSGFGANSSLNLGSGPALLRPAPRTPPATPGRSATRRRSSADLGRQREQRADAGRHEHLACGADLARLHASALQDTPPEQFAVPEGIRQEGGEVFMDSSARGATATSQATNTPPPTTPTQAATTPTNTPATSTPATSPTRGATNTPQPSSTRPPATATRGVSTTTPNPTSSPSNQQQPQGQSIPTQGGSP